MCGIAGWNRSKKSTLSNQQMTIILSILLSRMIDRGEDSYGYYANGQIVKGLGPATYGVNPVQLSSQENLMLHTRRASVGAKTIPNAHPWRVQNLVGLHNGGIANWSELNFKYNRTFDVDSMHIFEHLAQDLPLSELRGHGAVVFVDETVSKDIQFISRFNEGQMAIMGIGDDEEEPTDVIFASTEAAIIHALDVAKVPAYFPYEVKQGVLYYIENGKLWHQDPLIRLSVAPPKDYNFKRTGFELEVPKSTGFLPFERGSLARPDYDNFRHLPAVYQRKDVETKRFVGLRAGLEGYYGAELCSNCDQSTAALKMPLTELKYCIPCWEHYEALAPHTAGRTLKLEVPEDTLESRAEVDDEYETDVDSCELCQDRRAMFYYNKGNVLVCAQCAEKEQFSQEELVVAETTVPDDRVSLSEDRTCAVCHKEWSNFYYQSTSKRKLLAVCIPCWRIEFALDTAYANRPIKIGASVHPLYKRMNYV